MSEENDSIGINNKFISDVIALLVGFIILWFIGSYLVNKWIKSTHKRYKLPLLLCNFGIAVALGAILLLPVTILSHGLLHSFPDNVYLMWLDGDVIYGLWEGIFMGTNLSLFIILPFAYFYHETEDFHFGTSTSIEGGGELNFVFKFRSALINLALLGVMFGGTVYTLREILNLFAVVRSPFFHFSYTLITLVGSLFVLGFVHVVLWPWIRNIKSVDGFFFEEEWMREKEALEIEESYLKRKLNTIQERDRSDYVRAKRELELNCHFFDYEYSEEEITKRLQETKKRMLDHNNMALSKLELAKRTFLSTFWHTGAMIYYILNAFFLSLIVLRTAFGFLVNLTFGKEQTVLNYLNPTTGTYIGPISTIIDICVVLYSIIASFVGYFNVPLLKRFYSRKGELQNISVIQLISNTFLILIISSSLPISARILGLIRFDLLADFESFDRIRNHTKFIAFYKFLFLVSLVKRFVYQEVIIKSFLVARDWFASKASKATKEESKIK